MAEPKVLFEVDASKILAKLHLAGVQPLKFEPGQFIVNTGIKNDSLNATPDNPGKVEFDLTNTQGSYEAGFVTTIKYERSFEVQQQLDKLAKLAAQESNDKIFSKKLEGKEGEERDKILADIEKQYGWKIASIDDLKKAQEEAKKQTESNMDIYNEQMAENRKTAAATLKQYFTVFAGEDKAKGITEDSLVMINIIDNVKDSTDKRLVTNYEIRPMSDKDKELMLRKFQANPKKCEEKVCFKVGYTIELDK